MSVRAGLPGREGTAQETGVARTRIVAALLATLLALSCSSQPAPTVPRRDPGAAEPRIVIGLIPEQNLFRQLERYEPLIAYVSSRVGMRIELRILPRYGNIIGNFESTNLDGAFFGSFTYALAHNRIGVEPVARPVLPGGRSTYYGLILVRSDSGIRGAADLKGKRFAFVDQATTAGYLLPVHYLVENGIPDYRSHFREFYFAGTHEDVIHDVAEGRADAGAAKNTVFERMLRDEPSLHGVLTVIARSPDVPENGLALRRDFDPQLRRAIRTTLLEMHEDPRGREVLSDFGAMRFLETTDADYGPVYRYARESGIDLARYDYMNH